MEGFNPQLGLCQPTKLENVGVANWLFVLTEGSKNEWVGYDPEADRWHPLPKIPTVHAEWKHYGFSSVSVCNRFFVIGGSYARDSPAFPHQRPLVTNEVIQF
ncbi:hypothetical protein M0R45_021332 [Rubus argutus]|uniref:Uncharacterized protein n=1 Tax=Rubus argutus TaxID=59490 RepID=A0AAW1XCT7_RUBAR